MNDILAYTRPLNEPNTNLLRSRGWSIVSEYGPYCMAWKGSQEVLLVWRDGHWEKASHPGVRLFTVEALAS